MDIMCRIKTKGCDILSSDNIKAKNITEGDWSDEAIDTFMLVLDMWEFYGEYGIQEFYSDFDEKFLTIEFYGCGRWSF